MCLWVVHSWLYYSLTPFPHCASLSLSAAAGYSGIWGSGGGPGEPGPREPPTAGQVVPSGRGDPGLPWFSYSSEKWDTPLGSIYFTLMDNGSKLLTKTCFFFSGILTYLNESEPRSAAESGIVELSLLHLSCFLTAINNITNQVFSHTCGLRFVTLFLSTGFSPFFYTIIYTFNSLWESLRKSEKHHKPTHTHKEKKTTDTR